MQLHKRDVVEAATAILDNYGIADLTMRRLARELNVSPGALYWHFANKQQLLGAVADRILEPVGDGPGGWRDRVAAICRRLRDALLSHTDGAELVSASFAAGQSEAMARILARLADAAADAGVDPHARRAGGPHGRLLRAGIHRRRAVPAAVGRRGRRAARRAVGAGRRCRARGSGSGCAFSSTASPRTAARLSGRPTNVADVITVDDVRRITASLPRSYEVVVRDRIKFRVGQHRLSSRSRATRR